MPMTMPVRMLFNAWTNTSMPMRSVPSQCCPGYFSFGWTRWTPVSSVAVSYMNDTSAIGAEYVFSFFSDNGLSR